MNYISKKNWKALAGALSFGLATSLSAQVIFDFEDGVQGWEAIEEGAASIMHLQGFEDYTTQGLGSIMVTPQPDSWWVTRATIAKGTPEYDAIVAARESSTPMSLYFDVMYLEEFRAGFEGWFQLFLSFAVGEEWDANRYGDTNMHSITWDAENTDLVYDGSGEYLSVEYPFERFVEFDADLDLEIIMSANHGDNARGTYAYILDNFRLGPSGGAGGPVTEEPVTEEPVTEEPVTEEPVTEEPTPQEWLGYEVNGGWANTGGWLGHVYVEHSPWVYQLDLGWMYVSIDSNSEAGAWIYGVK